MTWFKVDDLFWSHPKVLRTSLAARGLWVSAGAYCAQHLTDGEIDAAFLPMVAGTDHRHAEKLAAELVAAGLWEVVTPGKYRFHHWDDMQPSREQVESRRFSERERKRRQRRDRLGQFSVLPGGTP